MKRNFLLVNSALITLFIILTINIELLAQGGVGINTSNAPPDPSAILDASATDQGALLPRMSETQRNAIINPAQGLIIFNTTTNCFNFYKNGSWWEWCGNCIGPQAPVAGNNSPVCEGTSLNLTASNVPGASYLWTGPNGFISTQQNPTIPNATILATGVYSVTATINCASQAGTTLAVVNALPSSGFTANPASPLPGQACIFSPSLTGATYSWTFQNGSPATSTSQNPSVTWAATGTYYVSLTVTKNSCSSTTSGNIIVNNCVHSALTFNYTGAQQTWTVPSCITSVTVDVRGAQGGSPTAGPAGGLGGTAAGVMTVVPGDILYIYVGGQNGWNGGGTGGTGNNGGYGGVGGGASDIRIGGTALSNRQVVAAGGGGGGQNGNYNSCQPSPGGTGGNGGGTTGTNGTDGYSSQCNCNGGGTGGIGGTQSAGGATGSHIGACTRSSWCAGSAGSLGTGGSGSSCIYTGSGGGGGGGGGYYGGGAGANGSDTTPGGGGGGGSSYTGTLTGASTSTGVQSGNGQVTITW